MGFTDVRAFASSTDVWASALIGLLAMSARERERLVVIGESARGRVKQSVAAQRPGMSVRKFKRNPDGSN